MNVKEALGQARDVLVAKHIGDANLEAEVLLRHTLSLSRVQLYLQFDRELGARENEDFWQLVGRRLNHEPAAYIIGHREFYGLDFYVDGDVLIPRPESELLVETALELAQKRPIHTIADVGTGSGAIAISLAISLPQATCGENRWRAKIYATDISSSALRVAQINCQKHGVTARIFLLQGDLLEPLPKTVDLIVANLPYVREGELSQVSTRHFEPSLALNGGPDGLETIRRLGAQVSGKLRSGGGLLIEIGLGQGEIVTSFFRCLFPSAELKLFTDGNGIDRVMSLLLPSAVPANEAA